MVTPPVPRGPHTTGSLAPNNAIVRAPAAAARCVIPESFPTYILAPAIHRARSSDFQNAFAAVEFHGRQPKLAARPTRRSRVPARVPRTWPVASSSDPTQRTGGIRSTAGGSHLQSRSEAPPAPVLPPAPKRSPPRGRRSKAGAPADTPLSSRTNPRPRGTPAGSRRTSSGSHRTNPGGSLTRRAARGRRSPADRCRWRRWSILDPQNGPAE